MMPSGKFLSIGVPAYNQGHYLRATIESLLSQDVEPLEIVVSDNHSSDDTARVAAQFGSRIRTIRPPRHMGMMEHWNFLVSHLRGDWFSLLSSDDVARSCFVSGLARGLDVSRNAILIRGGYQTIDREGSLLEDRFILTVRKVTRPQRTFYEQLSGPKVNFAAFAVRKTIWERVGGFPECCKLNGDWGFWLKISLLGDFVYVHEILSQFRVDKPPEITKARALDVLRDAVTIYLRLIPSIIRDSVGVDQMRYQIASRSQCRRSIAVASVVIEDDEQRQCAVEILREWAQASGCNDYLERLRSGERIPHDSRLDPVRNLVRRIVQVIRAP